MLRRFVNPFDGWTARILSKWFLKKMRDGTSPELLQDWLERIEKAKALAHELPIIGKNRPSKQPHGDTPVYPHNDQVSGPDCRQRPTLEGSSS